MGLFDDDKIKVKDIQHSFNLSLDKTPGKSASEVSFVDVTDASYDFSKVAKAEKSAHGKFKKASKAHKSTVKEFEKAKQAAVVKQVDQGAVPNLFEKLRQLRLELAKEAGIPAYQIFSDATLKEMEKFRPMSDEEFMQINGVGRQKMQNYGYQFIKAIIDFSAEKTKKKKKKSTKKGNTHLETLSLYQQGLSIEEIALQRQLAQSTIFSHIMKLYENGESIDLKQFVNKEDINAVKNAKKELDNPETLKLYFEHFEGTIAYNTIKLALTILEEESSKS